MDADDFFDLLEVAVDKEKEERLHRQWCTMLPFMSLRLLEYISFSDYIDKCSGQNIDMRPVSEIIADIEAAHEKAKQKRGEQ